MPPDHQSLAIWLTVSVLYSIGATMVIVAGSVWSAFRELHIRDERRRATVALDNVAGGISKLTLVGDMITQRISEMNHLSKEERRDLIDMLREYKREQVDLLTDIEKRLAHSIDKVGQQPSNPINLNQYSSGPNAVNQAGNNEQRQ